MSWEKALELLKSGESEQLEFIHFLTDWEEVARQIVALSNGEGGRIIIGLDDKNKHLTGTDLSKDDIINISHDFCSPKILPHVEIITREGRNIVVINVPEGNIKPYSSKGTIYIREGKISRPARQEEEDFMKGPWQTAGLNTRQKKALHYVSDNGSITNREYRSLLGVSHKTSHLELTELVKKKILASRGAGRSTKYIFLHS